MLAFQIELHAKQARSSVSANSWVYCKVYIVCSLRLGVLVYSFFCFTEYQNKSKSCMCVKESKQKVFFLTLFQGFSMGLNTHVNQCAIKEAGSSSSAFL